MTTSSDFRQWLRSLAPPSAPLVTLGDWTGSAWFGGLDEDYAAASRHVGVHDRSYRGLLEITGRDRATWLHNLTTNRIAGLQPGEGNYTFALNAKGRILFDMNVLVLRDALWVDIDIRRLEFARRHFEKYTIVEDVVVRDRSDEFVRLAVLGPGAADVMSHCGAANAAAAAYLQLGDAMCGDIAFYYFRHDLCGCPTIDLLVRCDQAKSLWQTLQSLEKVAPVGFEAVDVLRMEAGVPWPISEINDDVVPAETGQLHRAVSFTKGCYLGQEVVERMRSRQSLARKLSLIVFATDERPSPGAELQIDGKPVGQVTSACRSKSFNAPIALAYLRAAHAVQGTEVIAIQPTCESRGRVLPIGA